MTRRIVALIAAVAGAGALAALPQAAPARLLIFTP